MASPAAYRPRRRFILLVHGYNVTQGEGEAALQKFERLLGNWSHSVSRDVGWVFWPGDTRRPARALWYSLLLPNAREAAKRLTQYLVELTGPSGKPCEIILVGHSLGCRVILEAMDGYLRAREYRGLIRDKMSQGKDFDQAKIELRREILAGHHAGGRQEGVAIVDWLTEDKELDNELAVYLMAAAVPVDLVEAGGRLRETVQQMRDSGVLYSEKDSVLTDAFPLGQALAKGETPSREAVGSHGRPEGGLWRRRERMEGYGHGSYWDGHESSRRVAAWLGAPVPRAPSSRRIEARSLERRQIGG